MHLVIFDSIEPYVYEAVPILFYPQGHEYEARFKRKHVDTELVQEIRKNPERYYRYYGNDVLLCVRTKRLNGHPRRKDKDLDFNSSESGTITPLRYAKLVEISEFSGTVLIRYELGRLFSYDQSYASSYEKVLEKREILNSDLYENEEPGAGEFKHFSRLKGSDLAKANMTPSESQNSDAWRNVVSTLYSVPFLGSVPFLHFFRMDPMGRSNGLLARLLRWAGKHLDAENIWKNRDRIASNHLRAGLKELKSKKTYEIKIFESMPEELVPKKLRSVVEGKNIPKTREYFLELDDNFFAERRIQTAIGGYDYLEYVLPVRPSTQGSSGALYLSLDEKVFKKEFFISNILYLEYRVRNGWVSVSFLLGLLLLGGLAAATVIEPEIQNVGLIRSTAEFFGLDPDSLPAGIGKTLNLIVQVTGIAAVTQFLVRKR